MGLATLLTSIMESAKAQGQRAPSPEELLKQLPSSLPGPKSCSDLPELPAPSSEAVSQRFFPGFQSRDLKTEGAAIRVLTKGEGPPLLLLHGHPETHVTWHKIANLLTAQYTIILPDLRGYGDSSKPGYTVGAVWKAPYELYAHTAAGKVQGWINQRSMPSSPEELPSLCRPRNGWPKTSHTVSLRSIRWIKLSTRGRWHPLVRRAWSTCCS